MSEAAGEPGTAHQALAAGNPPATASLEFIRHQGWRTFKRGEVARDRYAAVPAEATDTPTFKAWFGDSKIKVNGRPAVVYHGSAEDIAAFSHDKLGTGVSELGFSLIQTCKALGIDPEVYLKDVLTRLPPTQQKDIDTLLPHYWSPGTSSTSDQANPTADAA